MQTLRSLTIRNLRYHWLAYLPVLLGVAVGAAVLAGALIVGDSLRGSLRDKGERQLNRVDSAWVGNRLVRTSTVAQLPETTPALMLRGSLIADSPYGDAPVTLPGITIIGLTDDGFRRLGMNPPPHEDGPMRGVLSAYVAGDVPHDSNKLRLGVQRVSDVPQSSLLGTRDADATTAAMPFSIYEMLSIRHPANDFMLLPSPARPRNLYVPLERLQNEALISGEDRRALRDPEKIAAKTGRVNAAFCFGSSAPEINKAFAQTLDLPDWGLRLRTRIDPPFGKKLKQRELTHVSVESERMLLEPVVAAAVERAAAKLGTRSARTTSYLANDISSGDRSIPYSIVAAVDPTAAPPLGPFLPAGRTSLAEDEIVLVDWPESPLRAARPGDTVTLTYFLPELETGATEKRAAFRLAGTIPLAGPAADPTLTPPFPGITDRLVINDWKPPFPYDNTRIRANDIHDQFWQNYRTTPKAYISRAAGERLFGSRFGDVTTIRVAPLPGQSVEQCAEALQAAIRAELVPAEGGLVFESTRERMLAASKGGTDFGMLLLMFSWLLIAAALLLVGLLFRLSVERRGKEVGLLLASGYTPGLVLRLLLVEGVIVAKVGALLGVAAAVAYAEGMLRVLASLWPDTDVLSYLHLHVRPESLLFGFLGAVLIAFITIWVSLRGLVRVPPPLLLRGQTRPAEIVVKPTSARWSLIGAALCIVLGVGCVAGGGAATNPDIRAGCFFSGGGLLMLGSLLIFRAWLRRSHTATIGDDGGMTAFGLRGATRSSMRSLLTATLIAFATFLLVAVESFRKKPGEDFLGEAGGSGGYRLLAETDGRPLFDSPDSAAARAAMLNELQAIYQTNTESGGPTVAERLAQAKTDLESVQALAFRLQGGDDASCLNLYQAAQPRVLGVPAQLSEKRKFAFAQTEARTPEEKENPWRLLDVQREDGAIPLIAEQNTVLWQLKTFVGSEVVLPDETGKPVRFRIVGTLQDSIFQSEVLISDANFRRLYPRTEGFRFFLLDVPADKSDRVTNLLTNGLRQYGLQITNTRDKVAAYQAVIGAYLTTFQLLGGFGLLLGVLGLGVVILRGIHERTGEFALLRSVGYRVSAIERLVLTEHLLLLLVGMLMGLSSALISVLPHLALGGSIPWLRLLALLGGVLFAGLGVSVLATRRIASVPLIPALRKE